MKKKTKIFKIKIKHNQGVRSFIKIFINPTRTMKIYRLMLYKFMHKVYQFQ